LRRPFTVSYRRVQRLMAETVSPAETLIKDLEGVNGCDVAVSPSFAALKGRKPAVSHAARCGRSFLLSEGA